MTARMTWSADPFRLIETHEEGDIAVLASGINRADLLQVKGLYPPPPGAPNHLGLEFSGQLAGRRIMGLTDSGAHSSSLGSQACAWVDLPDSWSTLQGAAWSEAAATVFDALQVAGAMPGQTVLVSAASGGIGHFAVRQLVALGYVVYGSCSRSKKAFVEQAGGRPIIRENYESELKPLKNTIDFSLDFVGGELFNYVTYVTKQGATWVQLGLLGGATGQVRLDQLLIKNVTVVGRTLRRRSLQEKQSLLNKARDLFTTAPLTPHEWPVAELPTALDAMAKNRTQGKQVLNWEGYERI